MKTKLSRIPSLRTLLFVLVQVFALQLIQAHEINDIEIHVVVNDLGHARVAELRDCHITNSGTEAYIKQYNLKGMVVGELQVSDETGMDYQVLSKWDVGRSRSEKANTCGINKVSEGVELCWGLGDSGDRIYNVHYTLCNLVKSYDDFDGFIFTFYEPDEGAFAPHTRVVIERENGSFSPEDTRIWAFRYHGEINIIEGKIVAETTQPFIKKGEAMVVMAQFNKGMFNPVAKRSGTFFNKVKKEAFKGSDYNVEEDKQYTKASHKGNGFNGEESDSTWSELWDGIEDLLIAGLLLFIPIYFLVELVNISSTVKRTRQMVRLFGNKSGKVDNWSRDLPNNGNLKKTAEVLKAVNSSDYKESMLIAAYTMRMVHRGMLYLQRGVDQKGNPCHYISITQPGPPPLDGDPDTNIPYLLHTLMWNAAGSDHVLQPKEMLEYMKAYPVEHREIVKTLSYYFPKDVKLKTLTPQSAQHVYALKKYLQELTLLNERHAPEVTLWREYLVHASLYGIAEQVFNDMRAMWPEYSQLSIEDQEVFESRRAFDDIGSYTYAGIGYVNSYETPAERAARIERESRSSGSGGSSSYGGGGGSSGGGGSGFR